MNAYEMLNVLLSHLNDLYGNSREAVNAISQHPQLKTRVGWRKLEEIAVEVNKHFGKDYKRTLLELQMMLAHVEQDKFIRSMSLDGETGTYYQITFEGMLFIQNGGYVERERQIKIEYKLKELQSKLNEIEIAMKPSTFWIALIGLLISIALAIHEMNK